MGYGFMIVALLRGASTREAKSLAAQMRRVLISLTLTLLLIVSVGTGIAVATWPQWRHWLH